MSRRPETCRPASIWPSGSTSSSGSAQHRGAGSCWRGLACALRDLRAAGCKRAYIDGSFITTKEHHGDFDASWDRDGVAFDVIDEVLLTFDAGRRAQKAKYRGELFPADAAADPLGTLFRDFFQRDRDGNPKGIIVIDLALPSQSWRCFGVTPRPKAA